MTHFPGWPARRVLYVAATALSLGVLTGCDAQDGPAAALRDFLTDLARSALAAFLL